MLISVKVTPRSLTHSEVGFIGMVISNSRFSGESSRLPNNVLLPQGGIFEMKSIASNLVLLSKKGLLVVMSAIIVVTGILGYCVTMWIPFVVIGILLMLVHINVRHCLLMVAKSVQEKGLPETAVELNEEVQTLLDEQAAAKVKYKADMARIKGEKPAEPKPCLAIVPSPESEEDDNSKPESPRLRSIK